jgi:hypothetical protein
MKYCVLLTLWLNLGFLFAAEADWQSALAQMPLGAGVTTLAETNCVTAMLRAFQSNATVKALIFMPGATDEFYMFHRARATLTNAAPTLLDAVTALTRQSNIRVTFRAPFVLLHSDEDPLEPLAVVHHEPTAAKLRARNFMPQSLFLDRDWEFMMPVLEQRLKMDFHPWPNHRESWHFYRHSFAAWNLTGWEALEAVSLAGKETFTVEKKRVNFFGDERVRTMPKL